MQTGAARFSPALALGPCLRIDQRFDLTQHLIALAVGVAPSALSSYHARVSHVDDRVPPLRHAELGLAAERLREALNRNPSIHWAYLFGSAARGEPFRDLDIGIVLKDTEARGAVRFGALIAALESAVPEFPLDVVELTSASPALRAAAVQQGRLLVDSDPDARKEWETRVALTWLDLAPWIARGQALRLESLRRKAG